MKKTIKSIIIVIAMLSLGVGIRVIVSEYELNVSDWCLDFCITIFMTIGVVYIATIIKDDR